MLRTRHAWQIHHRIVSPIRRGVRGRRALEFSSIQARRQSAFAVNVCPPRRILVRLLLFGPQVGARLRTRRLGRGRRGSTLMRATRSMLRRAESQ